jgi:hypothetical protein
MFHTWIALPEDIVLLQSFDPGGHVCGIIRGIVTIRVGKSQLADLLPLRTVTGQAIADYFHEARPATERAARTSTPLKEYDEAAHFRCSPLCCCQRSNHPSLKHGYRGMFRIGAAHNQAQFENRDTVADGKWSIHAPDRTISSRAMNTSPSAKSIRCLSLGTASFGTALCRVPRQVPEK